MVAYTRERNLSVLVKLFGPRFSHFLAKPKMRNRYTTRFCEIRSLHEKMNTGVVLERDRSKGKLRAFSYGSWK